MLAGLLQAGSETKQFIGRVPRRDRD
jgi:hypothetical protein